MWVPARQDSSHLVCSHEFGQPPHWEGKAFNAEIEGPKSLKALGLLRTERLPRGQGLYSVNWLVSPALPWRFSLARLGFTLRRRHSQPPDGPGWLSVSPWREAGSTSVYLEGLNAQASC